MEENREWRRLHNEELHSLYNLPIKSELLNLEDVGGHVARMGEGKTIQNLFR